jgi:polyisoprenoid-binding protein YceI
MTVDTTSVNTNHAERDKHIRGKGLLETNKFPQATFSSESVNFNADGTGTITGKLNLHGVEKEITMDIKKVGEGVDPWGGYRAGFEGTMQIVLADYGITRKLGKASETLELIVSIEGVRQHKK